MSSVVSKMANIAEEVSEYINFYGKCYLYNLLCLKFLIINRISVDRTLVCEGDFHNTCLQNCNLRFSPFSFEKLWELQSFSVMIIIGSFVYYIQLAKKIVSYDDLTEDQKATLDENYKEDIESSIREKGEQVFEYVSKGIRISGRGSVENDIEGQQKVDQDVNKKQVGQKLNQPMAMPFGRKNSKLLENNDRINKASLHGKAIIYCSTIEWGYFWMILFKILSDSFFYYCMLELVVTQSQKHDKPAIVSTFHYTETYRCPTLTNEANRDPENLVNWNCLYASVYEKPLDMCKSNGTIPSYINCYLKDTLMRQVFISMASIQNIISICLSILELCSLSKIKITTWIESLKEKKTSQDDESNNETSNGKPQGSIQTSKSTPLTEVKEENRTEDSIESVNQSVTLGKSKDE